MRLWQAGLLAALLGLWQLTTAVGLSDGFLISSPSRMWGRWWACAGAGSCCGTWGVMPGDRGGLPGRDPAGHRHRHLYVVAGGWRVLSPYLVVLNALPKTALGPIFIVWMGAGMGSIIVMTLAIS